MMGYSTLGGLLSGVALLAVAAPAVAQESGADAAGQASGAAAGPAGPSEVTAPEIIVTGMRASLNSAADRKRNSGAIVDSIVAEDIGKLPDNNVAESLQRITGVQITRSQGQGRGIAIRGLSQVQTLLDGRDIFTAGSRTLTVSDIPAELVAGIDVYKTSQADQIEGGLGGTVDLRLRRPFDFDGFELSGSVKGEYTDKLEKVKPYASLLVSDRWTTGIGDIGLLLGGSYQEFGYRIDRNAVGTYSDRYDLYDRDGDGVFPDDPDDDIVAPTDVGQRYTYGNRKQAGLNGSLQWAPSPDLEFHLDGLYTRYDSKEDNQLVYALTGTAGLRASPAVAVGPFEFAEDGLTVAKGQWTNARFRTSTYVQDNLTETYQFALGGKWTRDAVEVTGDISYNSSRATSYYDEFGIRGLTDTYDLDLTGFLPRISVTGIDPTNINDFELDRLSYNFSRTKGSQWAQRLDARFEIGDTGLTAIKIGFRHASRDVDYYALSDNYTYASGVSAADYADTQVLTRDDLFPGYGLSIRQWLTSDADLVRNYTAIRERLGYSTELPALVPTDTYSFTEKTTAGYIKGEFAFDLFAIPIDGNLGMRVVTTKDVGHSAVGLADGGYAPVVQDNSYTDALPSINVRAKLKDNVFLRFAASKSLTRPAFSSLNPALRLEYNYLTGSAGNAELDPLRAKQLDVSLEWYMPHGGLLYGAGFYKWVDGFIQNVVQNELHDGQTFLVSRPQNGNSGKIKGIELGYQQFFDFLPAPFDGLGLQANFTYVSSAAPTAVVGQTVPLENLSKYSYNLVGIYEKGGFSARLAYNWRSSFVESTNGGGSGGLPLYANAQPQLDASLSYDLTDRIAITFDAQNLTAPERREYYGVTYRPKALLVQDRRFQFGARFKL
ncbi:TonB-dependent receptor [Novosphingobium profundi]|uniref:TonB-dependent receptor n=1 Tax=Novosphingobium profundi TaxID=1774954 RepID=UPI001BD99DB3|nr:TonB-dependent receptor [Novosphingobium profundi]MBT0670494.1 TonB-dependent receptor [Novosphingobium profundi]